MTFDNVFPDSIIRFTAGFGEGMNAEEYSRNLTQSKICISPYGFSRAECFRNYEAMRAGSIVITHKLVNNWYIKGGPFIEIQRWTDLRKIVNNLLANPAQMQEIQLKTVVWWKEKCSPHAIANYMAGVISDSVNPSERPKHAEFVKPPTHKSYDWNG